MVSNTIVTVSQLCRYISALLEEQKSLGDLMVKGEISNLSYHSASGHLYFSLRDGDSLIRCVMFSRYAQRLADIPEDGTTAVVRGNVTLYQRDGIFQIIVYDLQPLGTGKGRKSLEDLKRQLFQEGLFAPEAKKQLEPFPEAVGVITSPDGAALHDIIQTFAKRNPLVRLIVYPALTQGSLAPQSILKALRAMEREGACQTAIIARGGGSAEDLSVFNSEDLVRGVYACQIPVISAVGHEVDFTLLDYVADARAATPTAACTLATVDLSTVNKKLQDYTLRLRALTISHILAKKDKLHRLSRLFSAASPQAELKKNRQQLEYLIKSLIDAQHNKIGDLKQQTDYRLAQLELLNPAALMLRGYTITFHNGKTVSATSGIKPGDALMTQAAGGKIWSTVTKVEEAKTDGR